MKRIRAFTVACAVLACSLWATPAMSAEADRQACASLSAVFEPGVDLPVDQSVFTYFHITFQDGTCSSLGSLSGLLTGNCGAWSATGSAWPGRFSATGVGSTIVLTGAVSGTIELLNWVPASRPNPCGARRLYKGPAVLTYASS